MLNQPETLRLMGEHLAHLTCNLDRVLVQSIRVPLLKGRCFCDAVWERKGGGRGGARCCLQVYKYPV